LVAEGKRGDAAAARGGESPSESPSELDIP
jgi:hypothetical protein